MEPVTNSDDIKMPKYDFDKPIKTSCIFEDFDELSEEENTQQSNTNQDNSHSYTTIEQNKMLSDNYYSNATIQHIQNTINIENERCADAEKRRLKKERNKVSYNIMKIEKIINMMFPSTNFSKTTEHCSLLDGLSESIIRITKLHYYYNHRNTGNNKKNYVQHKICYYHKSYIALVKELLPKEHKEQFITNFIRRTINVGHRMSWTHGMSYDAIRFLVHDMIQWAKQKREKRSNPSHYSNDRTPEVSVPQASYSASSAYNPQSNNIQVPISLVPTVPSVSYSILNNTPQTAIHPVSVSSSHLPMQLSSYADVNKQQENNMQEFVSLGESVEPLPQYPNTRPPEYSMPLPPYSISSFYNSQPNHLEALYSGFYSITNATRQTMRQPSSVVSSDQSAEPSSYALPRVNTNNIQGTVSLGQSQLSSAPRNIPNNWNSSRSSFSLLPNDRLGQIPTNVVNSVNTRQSTNIQAPVSLRPSEPSLSSAFYATSNNIWQSKNRPTKNRPAESVKPTSHNISKDNARHPPALPIEPCLPPLSYNYSNTNMQPPNYHQSALSSLLSTPPLNMSPPSLLPHNGRCAISRPPQPVSRKASTEPQPGVNVSFSNMASRHQHLQSGTNFETNDFSSPHKDNSICLISTGPPGCKIRISIDPTIAKMYDDSNETKKADNPRQYHETIRQNNDNTLVIPPATNEFEKSNYKHNQYIRTSNETTKIHTVIDSVVKQLLNDNTNKRSIKTSQDVISKRKKSSVVESPPIQYEIQNSEIIFNSKSKKTQPTVSSNNLHPEEMQYNRFDTNHSYPPLITRSESRDSGFGSPVLSALLSSSDFNSVYPKCTENDQECSPEIAHVTSMNPEATFIETGSCIVCGTATRNKCIACFKQYYCRNECQETHWPTHIHECTAI